MQLTVSNASKKGEPPTKNELFAQYNDIFLVSYSYKRAEFVLEAQLEGTEAADIDCLPSGHFDILRF